MAGYRPFKVSIALLAALSCSAPTPPAETPAQPQATPQGQWSVEPDDPVVPVLEAMPVTPASTPPASPALNPFENAALYVNPDYAKKAEAAVAADPPNAALVKKVTKQPTAMWLVQMDSLPHLPRWLEDVGKQAKTAGKPVVPVFLVYNLPNRDCSAKSSAGELTVENGGEAKYREFVDKIAAEFKKHPNQRIVVILEPDSLPNLATNLHIEQCAKSQNIYRNSVAYAIAQLSLPNVSLYLDAAHAGWLGWDGNRTKIAQIFKEVLLQAGGVDRIRGFATNVSNYTALTGEANTKLEPSNPCPNELSYVQKLNESLEKVGITGKGFIIDTSRNGRDGIRTKWGNWCNVKGAGIGERPRANPAPLIDAYLWIKPPGESDGTSNKTAKRFDENCVSPDAFPDAPEAGEWFQAQFLELAKNANPPL
jgi:cellulose 1,4-beta-cellobiosidase